MSSNQNTLITIIGPTAIGKTALSIQLANTFSASIISCDSRQFFKEMTIGTAVPEPKELAAAKHYFIQNRSVFDSYNVGEFERDTLKKENEELRNTITSLKENLDTLYKNGSKTI